MADALDHTSSRGDEIELAAQAHAIVRMGKALLNAGACTYRVRRCMGQVASALGIEWLQSQVTLNELTVTLFKGNNFRTQVGQVHSIGVNADKLSRLELLADELTASNTSVVPPAKIEAEIDTIDASSNVYPPWLNALAAAIAASAVGFLNNAWWLILIGVLIGAFCGQFTRALLGKKHVNPYVSALTSALVAAFVYIGVAAALSYLTDNPTDIGAGYVPAIIFLAPGFPLVNAALDLVKSDITAGLSRLTYAFLILISGAAALVLVTWAFGLQPDVFPTPALDPAAHWILSTVASFVGVTGWAIMFNSRFQLALVAGFVGLIANLVRLGALELDAPIWMAATAGCFIAGILSWLTSAKTKLAYATIAVPAALIMIPGAPAYRALVAYSQGDADALLANSSAAIFTIMGMAIGLTLARILTEKEWALDKRRPLP